MTYPEYPDEAMIREWIAHVAAKYGDYTDVGAVIEYDVSYIDIDASQVAGLVSEAANGPDGEADDALISWVTGWVPDFGVQRDSEGVVDGFRYSIYPSQVEGWPWSIGGINGLHLDWSDVAYSSTEASGLELVVGILRGAVAEWRELHEFAKHIVLLPRIKAA